MRVVLDTNVLGAAATPSEALHSKALELLHDLQQRGDETYLPSVVVAELGVDYLQRGAVREWEGLLDELRAEDRFRVIPLGVEIADRAARVRTTTRLKLPDAVVGASAISVGAELVVSEDPDLKKLRPGLKVEDIRRALKVVKSP